MVIDDEIANLKVFERVFRKEFTVVTASSGSAALAALAEVTPDVAFVDLRMPGMDGVAVLTELRRLRPAMRRYLLTGFGDLEETAAMVQDGLCSAVLPKPWDRTAIRAAIEVAGPPAEPAAPQERASG